MFKTAILILSFIGCIYSLQLTGASFTPCDDTNSIKSIDVKPCDKEPCTFTRGTTVSVNADFTSKSKSDKCKLEMKANLGSWIPISNEDVCGSYLSCPLNDNSANKLNYNILVDDALPAALVVTRWKLICDSGATEVFCADIKIKIA